MEHFNIRVYGILINDKNQVLISDELYHGQRFSKFPGGGLELGEGLWDGLKREFMEEFDLSIDSGNLLYVTEEVIPSAFDLSQVIGVYYQVFTSEELIFSVKEQAFDFDEDATQALRWIDLEDFYLDTLTFEMDRQAWKNIRNKILI
ncbi:NUDIX domain-containing protein [Albibacterium profundi]|uniref:NUDIX domain-containing protein n=1 Tax=Albibacterium profundi TaxID=3134906 RepID=A0ABV5CA06_9SPHI